MKHPDNTAKTDGDGGPPDSPNMAYRVFAPAKIVTPLVQAATGHSVALPCPVAAPFHKCPEQRTPPMTDAVAIHNQKMGLVIHKEYMGEYTIHAQRLTGKLSANAVFIQVRSKNNVKMIEFAMTLEQLYTRSILDEVRSRTAGMTV
jgi:hypothetical protein